MANHGSTVKAWALGLVTCLLASTAVAEGEDQGWQARWNNGIEVKSGDGAFKAKVGGYFFVDAAEINAPSTSEGSGVEFRTARIFLSGSLYEKIVYSAQFDLAGIAKGHGAGEAESSDAKTNFKDVYIGLDLGGAGLFQVGHFKEPFGLDELGSSKYTLFHERALPNALAPGRNTGFGYSNTFLKKRLRVAGGVFRDVGNSAADFSNEDEYHVTGRVSGAPILTDDATLHLGAAYSHKFRDGSAVGFKAEPEVHLIDGFSISSPGGASDGANQVGLELAGALGPFTLQSEFIYASVIGKPGAADEEVLGAYGQVAFFITGEHRPYSTKSGTFGRVVPKKNLGSDGCGAFEVAARFSHVDMDLSRRLRSITVGLNWYLFPNARIMLNYVHANLDNPAFAGPDDDSDSGAVRFQVDF